MKHVPATKFYLWIFMFHVSCFMIFDNRLTQADNERPAKHKRVI